MCVCVMEVATTEEASGHSDFTAKCVGEFHLFNESNTCDTWTGADEEHKNSQLVENVPDISSQSAGCDSSLYIDFMEPITL